MPRTKCKLSSCRSLVLYEGTPDDLLISSVLLQSVMSLVTQAKVRGEELNTIQELVPRVCSVMSANFPTEVTQLNSLEIEINRLNDGDLTPPTEEEIKPKIKTKEEIIQEAIEKGKLAALNHVNQKHKTKELKRLFQKITHVCHPNNTQDFMLRDLYTNAKIAYEENNKEALLVMFDGMNEYLGVRKIPKLFHRFLVQRKVSVNEVFQQILDKEVEFKDTLLYQMVHAYRIGNLEEAKSFYKQILEIEIRALTLKRNELLSNLGFDSNRVPRELQSLFSITFRSF
jgi:tetratricopeptide (TPR) repeat protein